MRLPSFAEFKKNQNSYYAFGTILALIFIFTLWINDKDKENLRRDEILKACIEDKKVLENKVEVLNDKLFRIVQKQSINDSIK